MEVRSTGLILSELIRAWIVNGKCPVVVPERVRRERLSEKSDRMNGST